MVLLTRILRASMRARKGRRYRFIDSLRIHVMGGAGGMGFPKYGGIGGKGGDVIVETSKGATFKNILKNNSSLSIKASTGGNSHSRCILGKIGQDYIIKVPVGVSIIHDSGHVLADLDSEGNRVVVAKGGPGGCEETGFSGLKGENRCVRLDLKLIADIGLVGFPNAGKSTLLKALSAAQPKIASYPFTTVKPNIGMIMYEDLRQISVADLPGLIEGAHKNVGMGHRFLRHVERTKLMLLVVDINGFQLNRRFQQRSCIDTVVLLNKELELYKELLIDKPAIIVVNKMDTPGAWDTYNRIKESLFNMDDVIAKYPDDIRPNRAITFDNVIPISAKKSSQDIVKLKETLRTYLDIYDEESFEDVEHKLRQNLDIKLREYGPKMI